MVLLGGGGAKISIAGANGPRSDIASNAQVGVGWWRRREQKRRRRRRLRRRLGNGESNNKEAVL